MGSCTRRHFLLSICFLQLVTIIERQVFDFLGYMWAPILANFFHIIFVIFGFYGAYHFRVKYVITYLIWSIIWIGWNTFLICFYLDVGELDKNSDILNLGTGSVSWFEINGFGCKPIYPINLTSEDPYRPVRPEYVNGCLIDYPIVEVIHSGLQCALAVLAILCAIILVHIFLDDDDRFDFMDGDAKSPQHTSVHPMYVSYTSIPTSASGTMLSIKKLHQQFTNENRFNRSTTFDNTPSNMILRPLENNRKDSNFSSASTLSVQKKSSQTNLNSMLNPQQKGGRKPSSSSSYSSFINRPDLKYTQISTEKLISGNNFDDSRENFNLATFKSDENSSVNTYVPFLKPDVPPSPPSLFWSVKNECSIVNPLHQIEENYNANNLHKNAALQRYQEGGIIIVQKNHQLPQSGAHNSFLNNSERNNFNQMNYFNKQQHKAKPLHEYQPYPDLSPDSIPEEGYIMPKSIVTRSPNLNRLTAAKRRQDRLQQASNFYDQIRDAPPGLKDSSFMMARAKSHDRLSQRNRRQNQNSDRDRPRSYCNM